MTPQCVRDFTRQCWMPLPHPLLNLSLAGTAATLFSVSFFPTTWSSPGEALHGSQPSMAVLASFEKWVQGQVWDACWPVIGGGKLGEFWKECDGLREGRGVSGSGVEPLWTLWRLRVMLERRQPP